MLVLKGKVGSIVMAGPPCSSYVFLNMGTSKRSQSQPFGDTARKYVRAANTILVGSLIKRAIWSCKHAVAPIHLRLAWC